MRNSEGDTNDTLPRPFITFNAISGFTHDSEERKDERTDLRVGALREGRKSWLVLRHLEFSKRFEHIQRSRSIRESGITRQALTSRYTNARAHSLNSNVENGLKHTSTSPRQ